MSYYYDCLLNWNDYAYEFYEWDDTDYLEYVKKIPLFKVKHKVLVDLIANNIIISDTILEEIKNKTLISDKKEFKHISYAALFTDTKNVIALEFNDSGLSISRSKLLVEDELNVLEAIYGMKETTFTYTIASFIPSKNTLRQIKEARKIIALEIDSLYEQQDLAKLKYLFYEYKKENIDDITYIYETIKNDLDTKFNEDILRLYYLIKLSYHQV